MSTRRRLAIAMAIGGSLAGCGCFVRGTRVATAKGARAIEELAPGELVLGWDPEARRVVERPVASSRRSMRSEIASLSAGERRIGGVTLDHPIYDATVERFVEVGDLSLGSRIVAWRGAAEVEEVAIDALEIRRGLETEVFDLAIDGPEHDFFADGVLAHNKTPLPGPDAGIVDAGTDAAAPDDAGPDACFAEGTRVATPEGPRPIESLREGDRVWSWDLVRRAPVARPIRRVRVAERDDLVELRAGAIAIGGVTPDHPVYDAARPGFAPVACLSLRSSLLAWIEGDARAIAVSSIARRPRRRSRVFDLTIDGPEHDFFAEGALAHNKRDAGGPAVPLDGSSPPDGGDDAG